MKVFITGAAGFIGSHLTDYFLDRGDEVLALDFKEWGPSNYLWQHRQRRDFRFFSDSILNEGLLRYLIRECDCVYHLAATVGVGNVIGKVLNVIEVNVKGTETVLRLSAEYGRRTLFTSTSEIPGKNPSVPFRESDDRVLGPTTVDRWVYSETKALGEYICRGYGREGLPVSIVRLFNVYGPRLDREGSGRVVSRFLRQAMEGNEITIIGDGAQTRCFTYCTDIIRGIVAAGERHESVGGIFNLGTDVETSINELVDVVCAVVGRRPPVRHVELDEIYGAGYEDIPRRVPDVTNARDTLRFEATVPLLKGIQSTYEWMTRFPTAVG